jgi:hypothetical protein
MASVRKRTWVHGDEKRSKWVCEYRDRSGAKRRKTFPTRAEAVEYKIGIEGELQAGTHTPDSVSKTVAEAGQIWLKACKVGRDGHEPVEASTLRQYLSRVGVFRAGLDAPLAHLCNYRPIMARLALNFAPAWSGRDE